MNSILISFIIIVWFIIMMLLRQLFFKKKREGIATDSLRFMAWLLDMLMLNAILMIGVSVYLLIQGSLKEDVLSYAWNIVNVVGYKVWVKEMLGVEIWVMVFYALLSTVMEGASLKGTLGKRAVGIGLYERLSFGKALIRNVVKVVDVMFWPVTIILSRLSNQRQWLHDRIVDSRIVTIFND